MMLNTDTHAARPDGHAGPLAVLSLDLRFGIQRFVYGDVNEVQWPAVSMRRVVRQADAIAVDHSRQRRAAPLPAPWVRGAEVRASQPRVVQDLLRRLVQKRPRVAE